MTPSAAAGASTQCFLVDNSKLRFLIDCGATSLTALKHFGVNPDSIDAVFVSHLHGDHFGGLVFIIRAATLFPTRTRPLTVAGPPGITERIEASLDDFFPGGA